MAGEYKVPILATGFRVFGCLTIVGSFVLLLVGIAQSGRSADSSIVVFLAAIASSLLYFGVGELIDLIGQIAYNTGTFLDVVERQGQIAFNHRTEILSAIQKLSDDARRPSKNANVELLPSAPPPAFPPQVSSAPQILRFYYQDLEGKAAGPVSRADLKRLFEDSVIGTDTLVCQEGAESWQRLEEILPA